jgi:hypothetical protein
MSASPCTSSVVREGSIVILLTFQSLELLPIPEPDDGDDPEDYLGFIGEVMETNAMKAQCRERLADFFSACAAMARAKLAEHRIDELLELAAWEIHHGESDDFDVDFDSSAKCLFEILARVLPMLPPERRFEPSNFIEAAARRSDTRVLLEAMETPLSREAAQFLPFLIGQLTSHNVPIPPEVSALIARQVEHFARLRSKVHLMALWEASRRLKNYTPRLPIAVYFSTAPLFELSDIGFNRSVAHEMAILLEDVSVPGDLAQMLIRYCAVPLDARLVLLSAAAVSVRDDTVLGNFFHTLASIVSTGCSMAKVGVCIERLARGVLPTLLPLFVSYAMQFSESFPAATEVVVALAKALLGAADEVVATLIMRTGHFLSMSASVGPRDFLPLLEEQFVIKNLMEWYAALAEWAIGTFDLSRWCVVSLQRWVRVLALCAQCFASSRTSNTIFLRVLEIADGVQLVDADEGDLDLFSEALAHFAASAADKALPVVDGSMLCGDHFARTRSIKHHVQSRW